MVICQFDSLYMIISKFDRATFGVLEIDRASEQDQPLTGA